jgi:ubiquitin C-terminal hydrolase
MLKVADLQETIDQQKNMEEEMLFETSITEKNKVIWPRNSIKPQQVSLPSNTMTASSSNSEDSKKNTEFRKMNFIKAPKGPGLSGLINLGNTCYFNCIIQCLIHTPLLQNFFSTQNCLSQLNKSTNPKKSLAVELSDLSKEVWAGNAIRLNPLNLFKEFTQRFSMFDDKNQHDCHEFLSMFLDALHEELRREGEEELKTIILENPENRMIEIQESERQWQLMQGNQGSIITDTCAGQTKTTLTCTSCGSTRILFEIFTNLSLPIPFINSIPIYVTIVPMASNIVKIAFMLPRQRKIKDILDEISSFSNIPIDRIILFDLSYNLAFRTYDNSPESSLVSLGITSKAELFAVEARKTVESCEEQGKKVKAFENQAFSINSQVDVLHSSGKWMPGRIRDINGESYFVEFEYVDGKEWKTFEQIKAFRSRTAYVDPTVYTLFITNVSANSRKRLGFPLVLTIGSWYTQEDLVNSAVALLSKVCSKDIKAVKEPFRISLIDSSTFRCALCRNPAGCSGCTLTKTKAEVRSLFMTTKKITILCEWDERFFSEEVKHDSSVVVVKDKEKNMSRTIDIEMCLNEFTKEEKLEMKCEKCPNNYMKMKMEIWKTPDILILSFKRFTYSSGIIEKINSLVNFPFSDFEISQFVKSAESSKSTFSTAAGQNLYELYAVVLHSGSVLSGHYTSLIKISSSWILFDDDCVLELKDSPDNSNLLSSSYLLMYRRKHFSSSNVINLTYDPV